MITLTGFISLMEQVYDCPGHMFQRAIYLVHNCCLGISIYHVPVQEEFSTFDSLATARVWWDSQGKEGASYKPLLHYILQEVRICHFPVNQQEYFPVWKPSDSSTTTETQNPLMQASLHTSHIKHLTRGPPVVPWMVGYLLLLAQPTGRQPKHDGLETHHTAAKAGTYHSWALTKTVQNVYI